ncbi:MAG: alpha/beta hydrolase [Sulfitobacter sp.]
MRVQTGFTPHVTNLGQGQRRALALHCTLAFGGVWAGVARHLGQDMSFVAPDMPSHGESPDWDGQSDFSDTVYAAALASLDDAPMDLIGHSFGGMTALRLAAEHPERIRSLTLIEPVFFSIASLDAPATMEDHDARATPFFEAITAGDHLLAARAFNRMWSRATPWDILSDRSRSAMARAIPVVPDSYEFLYKDAAGLLKPGVLDRVHMPTLLMRGADALPAIVAINDGLEQRLPDATQAVIEKAGHMAPITHPTPVAEAIHALLHRS